MKEAKAREKAIKLNPAEALKGATKAPHGSTGRVALGTPQGGPVNLSEALWTLYRDEWSRSTAGGWKSSIKVLEDFFGPTMPLEAINTGVIQSFVANEYRRGMASSTINRRLATLSKALSWGVDNGHLTSKPRIPRQEETEGRMRVFSPEEVSLLVTTFTRLGQEEMARYITVLYGTGARPAEALRIKVQDVELETGRVFLEPGKTKRSRMVPASPDALEAIKAQVSMVGAGKLFRFGYDSFQHYWDRVRGLLGKRDDEGWVPYTLRHSYASLMVQNGAHVAYVQKLMGHSRLDQTMVYAKVHDGNLWDAVGCLPRLSGE